MLTPPPGLSTNLGGENRVGPNGPFGGHACSRTRPFYVGFSHTVDPFTGRGAEHGHACSRTCQFYVGFSHTQPCVDPVTGRGAEHGHACSRTRPFYVGYSPRSSDR